MHACVCDCDGASILIEKSRLRERSARETGSERKENIALEREKERQRGRDRERGGERPVAIKFDMSMHLSSTASCSYPCCSRCV